MTVILIDKFEPPECDEILAQHCATSRAGLAPNFLDYVGFFPDGRKIAIERKHVTDLAGRVDALEKQLKRAMTKVAYVVLIVEGVMKPIDNGRDTLLYREKKDGTIFYSTRTAGKPYSYYIGFIYRLAEAGIPTLWTANLEGTMAAVAEIVKLANKQEPSGLFKRIIRTRQTLQSTDVQVETLVQIGFGEKTAQLLLQPYKTVWELIHRSDTELLQIKGVGAETVKRLKERIGKP